MRAVEWSILQEMWQTSEGDQEMRDIKKQPTPVPASVSKKTNHSRRV